MKTLLKLLFLSIFIFTTALAYTPNENDVKIIETAGSKVVKLVDGKSELYKSKVIIQLEKLKSKYSTNERISYILDAVIDKISYKQESGTGILYDVISVVDGDTIKIDINGKTETIRILGIDTPEKFATRTGYKECYGEEASDYAKKLLTGKKVRIEFDDTQDKNDKYGRVLAHIFLEDGSYY
ncbi:MAG: thermonuclease family protein, partial [Candidatus Gracilibacteria bacterium]|nr:thermonuclease family protein [Candidatus Gracilibacteria bacterium]